MQKKKWNHVRVVLYDIEKCYWFQDKKTMNSVRTRVNRISKRRFLANVFQLGIGYRWINYWIKL